MLWRTNDERKKEGRGEKGKKERKKAGYSGKVATGME